MKTDRFAYEDHVRPRASKVCEEKDGKRKKRRCSHMLCVVLQLCTLTFVCFHVLEAVREHAIVFELLLPDWRSRCFPNI